MQDYFIGIEQLIEFGYKFVVETKGDWIDQM